MMSSHSFHTPQNLFPNASSTQPAYRNGAVTGTTTATSVWEKQQTQQLPAVPARAKKFTTPGVQVTNTKQVFQPNHHQTPTYNCPLMTSTQTQTPPLTVHSGHLSPKSPNQCVSNIMMTSMTNQTTSSLSNGGGNYHVNANINHNNNNINSSNNNNNFDNANLNSCTSTNATTSSLSSSNTVTPSGPPQSFAGAAAPSSTRLPDPTLQNERWFHGSITREEAERLLQPREDGLFLVRESTNYPGDYTLCVCFQGKVEHYRVKYAEKQLTIDDEEFFSTLAELIKHYMEDADGLCTKLIRSLPKLCIRKHIGEQWVISEKELTLKESIGKGEFGEVKLGKWKDKDVAVKVLKHLTEDYLKEALMMSKLFHENIVEFHGVAQHNCYIYLIFEYMSKGSLVDYLRSRGRQHVTKKDQIDFAYDTCSGMDYLEQQKIVHRDLAARNVLISEKNVAKICDLGLAFHSDNKDATHIDVGKLPIKWTAPESLKGNGFSNKSDMWSFGILLWEIYSFGRVPYPRIPLTDVMKYVEQNYKMEAPEGCPTEVYEMMQSAWNLKPHLRPSFHDLKIRLKKLKDETK